MNAKESMYRQSPDFGRIAPNLFIPRFLLHQCASVAFGAFGALLVAGIGMLQQGCSKDEACAEAIHTNLSGSTHCNEHQRIEMTMVNGSPAILCRCPPFAPLVTDAAPADATITDSSFDNQVER